VGLDSEHASHLRWRANQNYTNSGFAEDLLRYNGISVFIEFKDWLPTLNRFSLCWREILFIWSSFVWFRIFPIVWTVQLLQCIARPTFIRVRENYHPTRFSSGLWNLLDLSTWKSSDWELWRKFLRRIHDECFAWKQIKKYVQGVRTMMTVWSCK
jgi:hypothetical protein